MRVYQEKIDYLVSYDIQGSEIIQHYYKDPKKYTISNIPHNIEFCNRKLIQQFQDHKENKLLDLTFSIGPSIFQFSTIGITGILMTALNFSDILSIFCFGTSLYHLTRIFSVKSEIKHIELTEFCLEHIMEIKEIVEIPNYQLKISKRARQMLTIDQGFTLNHSDQYSVKDLKQLKKAITTR